MSLCEWLRNVESLVGRITWEELKNAVPENTEILVIFLANETAEMLAKHPGLVLRADFSENTQDQPLWEISASADLYIREAVMSFSSSDAKLDIKDEDSEGSQMRNKWSYFTSGNKDIQRALCTSFAEPSAICESLLCAPHSWLMVYVTQCVPPPDCQSDFSDCSHAPRDRRLRRSSGCAFIACVVGTAVGTVIGFA